MMRILVIACIAFLLVQNRSLAQSVTPYCPNTVVPTADTLNVEFPIPVAQHGKWGYVDRAGGFVITPQFDCAGGFSEHLAAVKIGKKWGYTDTKGNLVIPAKYAEGAEFTEGLALVLISEGWRPFGNNDVSGIELGALATYIDHMGRPIRSPFHIKWAGNFSEGLAPVAPGYVGRLCGNGKVGYLDQKGHWAVKPQFDDAGEFSDGMAAVNQGATCHVGGQWGYIDKSGKLVIPYQYQYASSFRKGEACVRQGSQWKVIGRSGKVRLVDQQECSAVGTMRTNHR